MYASSDLSALSYMPYLLELDASHNLLGHLLDFAPPKNLKSANFSFNQIEDMGDLSDHHYLTKLVLDNNELTQVKNRKNTFSFPVVLIYIVNESAICDEVLFFKY